MISFQRCHPLIINILITGLCAYIGMVESAKLVSEQNSSALVVGDMMKPDSRIQNAKADVVDDEDVYDEEAVVNVNSTDDIKGDVKTAVQTSENTSLSVWGIVGDLWNWLKSDISESLLNNDSLTPASEERTFGKIRRLQMALIPIIFKFGVLSAMVAFLVVLGMKSLFLLKVLVLMNAAVILGKFLTFKTNYGHFEHSSPQPWGGYSSWNPHVTQGWSGSSPAPALPQNKEIHLHIHGGQVQPQVSSYTSFGTGSHNGWESRNDPYGAYEPTAAASETNIQNDLNKVAPIQILPEKYPTNL